MKTNLINPYKKFNPDIYEQGRLSILKIFSIMFLFLIIITWIGLNMEHKSYFFPVIPLDDYPTPEEAYPLNFTMTWWIICSMLCLVPYFEKKSSYFLKIRTKFTISKFFSQLDSNEIKFIDKNFKKMDFKSKTWWINPHKGYWSWKGKTQNFDEDVKKYTKQTNKKAFFHSDQLDLKDDLEMKKLQSTYYWVVIVLGFVLYNFLKY